MAKEIIQLVRDAELEAAELEKEAFDRTEDMKRKAESEGSKLIAEMVEKAYQEAEEEREKREAQGEMRVNEAGIEAEQAANVLQELAGRKEEEAIRLVCSIVL